MDSYDDLYYKAREGVRTLLDESEIYDKLLEAINFCSIKEEIDLVKFRTQLKEIKIDIYKINESLKKEFKIACLGLEKAGKSSLLCSWLNHDVLPTSIKRCTNTITEIYSCDETEDEKYIIDYFTRDEFLKYKDLILEEIKKIKENSKNREVRVNENYEMDEIASPGNTELTLLEEEREEILKFETQILRNIDAANGKPREEVLKNGFDDINTKEFLKTAISDPSHARGVKRVKIWSKKLSSKKNIVLIDVPGYNSPLKNHKDQTFKIVKEADAILFVKNLEANPNIEMSENEILKMIDQSNNRLLKATERIIVALTKADKFIKNKKSFQEHRQLAETEWNKKGVTHERLINCSSILKSKTDEKLTNDDIKIIKEICGGSDGIDTIKIKIDDQIISKYRKTVVLNYEELKRKFINLKNSIITYSKTNFSIENEIHNNSISRNNIRNEILDKWWAEKWQNIWEQFQLFYQKDIFPRDSPDHTANKNRHLIDFRKKYLEIVDKIRDNIDVIKRERMKVLYSKVGFSRINSVEEGHAEIRKELNLAMYKEMSGLAEQLADILCLAISDILTWINDNLWGISKFKDFLLDAPLEIKKKTYADRFETLILRLSRPANDLFLRFPRFATRERSIKQFYREVMILDLFYNVGGDETDISENENGNEKKHNLPAFLANGHNEQEVEIDYKTLKFNTNLTFAEHCKNFDDVATECIEDFEEFIKYLKHSIYFASGIESLFELELDNIALKFQRLEKEEGKWHSIVFQAIAEGNELICPELTDKLNKRDFIIDTLKYINSKKQENESFKNINLDNTEDN